MIGELTQEIVRLVVDPGETALWAICRRGHPFTFSYSDEELIAFSPDGSGVLQRFSIPGHEIFDTCFLGDALITAGWDATIRIWDWRQPTPLAAMSGSAPFRCVSAAADRIVAGDQKGNMWFLAPISELYAQT